MLALLFWIFSPGGSPATTGEPAPVAGFPQDTQYTPYNSSDTSSQASSGGFLSDPDTTKDPSNPGHYFVGPGPNSAQDGENPPYVVEYIQSDQSFTIGIMQEPLGQNRLAVEHYLREKLGISQALMCALNYTVSVPYYVNQIYAGQNLGFSFCDGAVQLP